MAEGQGPVVVSVINMKGGVGKTTVAALLARYASINLGLDVLAIDLDPQANLSQAFMGPRRYQRFLDDKSPSIVEVFDGRRSPSRRNRSPRPLSIDDVLVGNTGLGGTNVQIVPSRFDFSKHLLDAIGTDEQVLAGLIADEFQHKDLVIIDCAPTESIFTHVAYHSSGYILVPVKPEYFATIGFSLLNDSLDNFRRSNRGHQIDVVGIVINNSAYHYSGNRGGPERERSIRQIYREADSNNWHVFENQLPLSRGFPKMMRGNFTHLGDAPLYRLFASEFFERLGLE